MITVNLLPGGKSRSSRGLRLSLPSFKGVASVDRWTLAAAALAVLCGGGIGYLYWHVGARTEELTVAIEDQARDSARYADIVARNEALLARRDSIAERVAIIQEIDQGRYVWPHVLDEVARALPDYTWLTGLVQLSAGTEAVDFRIAGKSGNNFALTRFMENLEASPFVRSVTLISTEQVVEAQEAQGGLRTVHDFTVEATYQSPPDDFLETVPLFASAGTPALP